MIIQLSYISTNSQNITIVSLTKVWLQPGSTSFLTPTSNPVYFCTQIGRIIIFFVHNLYCRTPSFYFIITKQKLRAKQQNKKPCSSDIHRDHYRYQPLHLQTSPPHLLILMSDPTDPMKILVLKLVHSFFSPCELQWFFLEPKTPLWIVQYSYQFSYFLIINHQWPSLSPTHDISDTQFQGHISEFVIIKLTNAKILKACIPFYHNNFLTILYTYSGISA